MPNIEIHGFSFEEGRKKKKIIDEALRKLGLAEEAITTIIPSETRSCCGADVDSPYIRILSTGGMVEITKIAVELAKFDINMDCEKVPLHEEGFVEAKLMSSSYVGEILPVIENGTKIGEITRADILLSEVLPAIVVRVEGVCKQVIVKEGKVFVLKQDSYDDIH